MDAINCVQKHHSETGKSCKILGYSYGNWYSWLPNLSTIIQPDKDLGYTVGQQILHRIEHPDAPVKQIIFSSYYNGTSPQ
jgi:DNA-binding LacI/PurR family transcriptional regulator